MKVYECTGFGELCRRFEARGATAYSAELADVVVREVWADVERGALSSWKWTAVRRGAALLEVFDRTGSVDLAPLPPWKVLRLPPTPEQLADQGNEREQLAGSLLPDLLAEAAGNLRAATAAVDNQTGTNPHETAMRQRSVPATLTDDNYPVLAWIPTFSTDDGAIAVGYRPEPEHDHAPYVVWTVQAQPSEPGRYRVVDAVYDVEDLGEAMLEAIARAEQEATRAAEGYDRRDGSPS